jgi:hypothetical protein
VSGPDRTSLPIRRGPFAGVANRTLSGSQPDRNLIGHPASSEHACTGGGRAVTKFSKRYAEQNERDYEHFVAAVASGRLVAQEGV